MKDINNVEEAKKLSIDLQKELDKLRSLLNKLENNITSLSGDIWNGANAYEINKSLVGHLDHDKTLLNKLEKCALSLEEIVR